MHLYLCMLLLNLLFCDINCVCCSHNTTSIEKEKRCDIQETRDKSDRKRKRLWSKCSSCLKNFDRSFSSADVSLVVQRFCPLFFQLELDIFPCILLVACIPFSSLRWSWEKNPWTPTQSLCLITLSSLLCVSLHLVILSPSSSCCSRLVCSSHSSNWLLFVFGWHPFMNLSGNRKKEGKVSNSAVKHEANK